MSAVYFSGSMTTCPGYLCITVNDKLDLEEIARYDLLISCPPEFNITFFVPITGDNLEKTFDITLDDATNEHQVYLTNMIFELDYKMSLTINHSFANLEYTGVDGACTNLFLLFLLIGILLCTYLCIMANLSWKTSRKHVTKHHRLIHKPWNDATSRSFGCTQRLRHMSKCERVLVAFCILFQLLQCILVTFTTASLGFFFFLQYHIRVSSGISQLYTNLLVAADEMIQSVEGYASSELERQFSLMEIMETACDHYFEDLTHSVISNIENYTHPENFAELYLTESSVSSAVLAIYNKSIVQLRKQVHSFIKDYRQNTDLQLRADLMNYVQLVHKIVNSPWLMYAHSIFNQTKSVSMLHRPSEDFNTLYFSNHEVAFASFLNLQSVELVNLWQSHLWDR